MKRAEHSNSRLNSSRFSAVLNVSETVCQNTSSQSPHLDWEVNLKSSHPHYMFSSTWYQQRPTKEHLFSTGGRCDPCFKKDLTLNNLWKLIWFYSSCHGLQLIENTMFLFTDLLFSTPTNRADSGWFPFRPCLFCCNLHRPPAHTTKFFFCLMLRKNNSLLWSVNV